MLHAARCTLHIEHCTLSQEIAALALDSQPGTTSLISRLNTPPFNLDMFCRCLLSLSSTGEAAPSKKCQHSDWQFLLSSAHHTEVGCSVTHLLDLTHPLQVTLAPLVAIVTLAHPLQKMINITLLLGMLASHLGSINKKLSTQLEVLLLLSATELPLSHNTQVSVSVSEFQCRCR